jgi:hypothetical protein
MKRGIRSIYIPLLVLVVLGSSCKKEFLDLKPYNGLETEESIKNEDDMDLALNGTYARLRNVALYGRTLPLFGDIMADNVYISTRNSNRYLDFFLVSITVSNANARDMWQAAYGTILNANNILESEVPSSPVADQYRGEALALRALMYFELVKHFSKPYTVDPDGPGVPLVLTYDPFKKPARNTTREVYAQIQKDLEDAIPLLADDRSSGYFTATAAKALLARMHLFKAEWKAAQDAADEVIGSSYELVRLNQYASYWSSNTPRNDQVETLFEVVMDLVGNAGNDALAYFYNQEGGYGDALAAQSLYNLYSATDVRRSLILPSSPTRGNVKVVNKYPNATQPDKDEFKILRMSEMYLTAAEAAYQQNNAPTAREYLNALAEQRDPNFIPYTSTGTTLLNDILNERRKELAFEGQRYWDLARYNRDVVRVNLANNYTGAPLTIPATSSRRIFPIPQAERDANPNIQQNPGY